MREGLVRPRVLIVDDEESTRLLLARILTADLDAEVQLAGTSEQAIKLATETAFEAILLDLLMPGTSGYSILKAIRASGANRTTPVIVVSVLTDEATIDECMSAGASAYHAKPVRRDKLIKTIQEHIAAWRKSRSTT